MALLGKRDRLFAHPSGTAAADVGMTFCLSVQVYDRVGNCRRSGAISYSVQALKAGADYLVIRPITASAWERICDELAAVL